MTGRAGLAQPRSARNAAASPAQLGDLELDPGARGTARVAAPPRTRTGPRAPPPCPSGRCRPRPVQDESSAWRTGTGSRGGASVVRAERSDRRAAVLEGVLAHEQQLLLALEVRRRRLFRSLSSRSKPLLDDDQVGQEELVSIARGHACVDGPGRWEWSRPERRTTWSSASACGTPPRRAGPSPACAAPAMSRTPPSPARACAVDMAVSRSSRSSGTRDTPTCASLRVRRARPSARWSAMEERALAGGRESMRPARSM